MWLARELNRSYLFDTKPIKRNDDGDKYFVWEGERYIIDGSLFPEVTFENSPVEVELKIERSKYESTIQWQHGEPKEEGNYLVSLLDGRIEVDKWLIPLIPESMWDEEDVPVWEKNDEEVVAWCKLSDIKPYKEERK